MYKYISRSLVRTEELNIILFLLGIMKALQVYSVLLHVLAVTRAAPVELSLQDNIHNNIPSGVLAFDIEHKVEPANLLHKRGLSNDTLLLTNSISFYTLDFKVGSPPQAVSAVLDTGSSDLWLYDKQSGHRPYYDSASSLTYEFVNDHLFISYGSGPVMGNWVRDTVKLSSFPLKNATFGLVTRDRLSGSKIPGILGVGKVQNEATDSVYPNIPALLYQEGYIQKNAYSISLNELSAKKGSCIFGGMDTSKYKGNLYLLPMIRESHLAVKLDGISFVTPKTYGNQSITPLLLNREFSNNSDVIDHSSSAQALLDTGTSFMYLPDSAVDQIISRLGAVFYPQFGVYFVPSLTASTPSLSFNFSGATIQVSPQEYIAPASLFTTDLTPMPYILTIFKASLIRGYVILGGTFLRSAYVVFDLTENQVAIGQANIPSSSSLPSANVSIPGIPTKPVSNILPIVSSIPGAIPAPLISDRPLS